MSPKRFGIFELDTTSGELRKRGVKIRLPEQVYRVLNTLLEHPGEVVSRERLKESVWPDRTFVDFESALNKCISQLRTILGDSGHNPRFIETLSKRGYRFIAPIQPTRRDDSSRSIVVVPFDSPFDHGAQSYLAAGVTDMLTTALGEVRLLKVISRTSANAFVTSSKPLSALGRELDVDLAVEGSVIRLEPAICVTVRLVDIHSELVVWQGQYDAVLGRLTELCSQVVQAITTELELPLRPAVAAKRPVAAVAPDAQLAYFKGRYLWNRRTERDLYGSIEEFQRALAIDSSFAIAHTGLADAYILLGIWGLQPAHTAFRMARRAADRALELNADLAEAHTCLAEVLKDYDWDWPAAEREYHRAITLNPNYSTAHHFYAQLLVSLSRYREAVEQIELARRLDPLSPAINAYVPYIFLASRDYAQAIEQGSRAVDFEPHSPTAHWQFGRACLFGGAVETALSELEIASELSGGLPMWRAELCFARAHACDVSGATAILDELTTRARSSYVSPYDIALCHAGLGSRGAALDHLEHAYRERVMRIISIGDPELDALRSEPRFLSLVARLRLSPAHVGT